jgi:hypothetical protein
MKKLNIITAERALLSALHSDEIDELNKISTLIKEEALAKKTSLIIENSSLSDNCIKVLRRYGYDAYKICNDFKTESILNLSINW